MIDTTAKKKRKWRAPYDPTKFRLHYPPPQPIYELPKGKKVEGWDNWSRAMRMDVRLSDTDRSVLAAIVSRYNLTTGECFPMHGRVAMEIGREPNDTGLKVIQRAVSKAERFGWIKKTLRCGGPRAKSQSNLYELTLPRSIRNILKNVGPTLEVTGAAGAWNVTQTTDGVAVCGPFKDRANAERWIAEHGPTGQIARATGQIKGGRPDNRPPHNREEEQGSIEHPYFVRAASAPQASPASQDALTLENYKRKKEEFEGRLSPPRNAEPSIEFPLGECSREIGDAARGDGDAAAQRLSDDR